MARRVTAGRASGRHRGAHVAAALQSAALCNRGCDREVGPVPCSVLVVDDQQVFADALAAILSGEDGVDAVTTARTLSEARRALTAVDPDVVVVEATIGDTDALTFVTDACDDGRERAVVVVADRADARVAIEAIRAGATGFVLKDTTVDALVRTVVGASHGEMSIPPPLLGQVIADLLADERDVSDESRRLATLTAREREVLDLMVAGLDRAGIAMELFTSVNTVRTHTQSVFRKLAVHSSVEAVAVALRARRGRRDRGPQLRGV
jgi:two-component system nitrate/nitrite response regulator NarL